MPKSMNQIVKTVTEKTITIKADNRGEKFLWCTGVKLYKKCLLEGLQGSGCDP